MRMTTTRMMTMMISMVTIVTTVITECMCGGGEKYLTNVYINAMNVV